MVLAIVTTVLTGAIAWLVSTAWATKADKDDFIAHVQDDAMIHQADTTWKREQHEMVMEILCRQNPKSWRCRPHE